MKIYITIWPTISNANLIKLSFMRKLFVPKNRALLSIV